MTKKVLKDFPVKGIVLYSLANYLQKEYVKERTDESKGQFFLRDYYNFIVFFIYNFLFQLSEFKAIRSILKLVLFSILISAGFVAHKILGTFLPLRTIVFNISAKKYSHGSNNHRSQNIHDEDRKKMMLYSPAYKHLGGNIHHNRHFDSYQER